MMTVTDPMHRFRTGLIIVGIAMGLAAAAPTAAGELRVAVASNFADAAREVGSAFEAASAHRATFSVGSTGQLFTQIANGAPFDVFLAADQERPARAVAEGLAVAASRFTYARGRLALYSRDPGRVAGPDTLRSGSFTRLAIANPDTAPYGAAAVAVMTALGVLDTVQGRIVRGANIAQAYQFVVTGNAELGFVALSQILRHGEGSRWLVPADLHDPIAQDAVLLTGAVDRDAARAFLAFLRGPETAAVLEKYGYEPGD